MKYQKLITTFLLLTICHVGVPAERVNNPSSNDPKATQETIHLYRNLLKIPSKGILFGHQDATLYGIGWKYEKDRSDVKTVCGDYPAVYGWEIGHIEQEAAYSLDSVYFSTMRQEIIKAYKRGGINTISWHCDNPLTGGNTWDVSSKEVVKSVLPGGKKHALFLTWLDRVAQFLNSLETEKGIKVPILFRPYHEHTGSWFWWGKNLCSAEEYKTLFQFTVEYLRKKEVHHLLYTYSPDNVSSEQAYFERYPGDTYVDILGIDMYHHGGKAQVQQYINSIHTVFGFLTPVGKRLQKPVVFSETGSEGIPMNNWWTEVLLKNIEAYPIAYVLVWRNAYDRPRHYFGPHPAEHSATDFVRFYQNKKTLFQKDLPAMYK
ncbi:glycoside hydrolase family 26 protein [Parabacteroides pacaensis]|uniref:glycoside hydrolase family 26 protein n=1 Tax=Parabacteroides pacaensis TaxID=2086575 RepID=UPI000D10172A|nr:glycosyl hydrolase [Parabacteroides pacaensis]